MNIVGLILAITTITGCEPAQPLNTNPTPTSIAKPQPKELLVFPDELRVENESLNEFVTGAMRVCAEGDYDAFRLLWSVHEDPMERAQFEEGWNAVTEIRIRALEKIIIADGDQAIDSNAKSSYALLASVTLDPQHRAARAKPTREAVLVVVREQDQWRFTHPPRKLREWMKKRFTEKDSPPPEETQLDINLPNTHGD